MNNKVDELDINSATEIASVIQAHYVWKERIQAVVDGTSTEELIVADIAKDNLCILGKWIYGAGMEKLSDNPLFQSLFETHRLFHLSAAQAVELAQSGRKDLAQESIDSGDYATKAKKTIGLLTALYRSNSSSK